MNEFDRELSGEREKLSDPKKTAAYSEEKYYERFKSDISRAENGGEIGDNASRDLKFLLEEKREKLGRRGVTSAVRYEKIPFADISGHTDSDNRFKIKSLFGLFRRKCLVKGRNGKEITDKQNVRLYQTVTAVTAERDSDNERVCCPKCGHIQRLKSLESACEGCGESSFIVDIYPKTDNYYSVRSGSVTIMDIIKTVAVWCMAAAVLGIPAGVVRMIESIPGYVDEDIMFGAVKTAFYTPIEFAALGIVGAVFTILGRLIFDNMKLTPIKDKANECAKKISEFMQRYDKKFSYSIFISRMYYLAELMLFSDSKGSMAVADGNGALGNYSAVDVVFSGITGVRQMKTEGAAVVLELEISARCVFDVGERVYKKDALIVMTVCRHISVQTDMGFEYSNVECEACGERFSLLENKVCPYCSMEPEPERYEWAVKDMKLLEKSIT